jgi:hypothetical protein
MNKKKDKKPTKTSIALAWIILIVCITLALALTYLKFFTVNKNTENNINESNVSPVITEALQTIVDNFNNNELINKYKEENINITATLSNTTITINYSNNEINKNYDFNFVSPLLNSKINNNDIEEFKIIYKILVYACQQRLDNYNNIDSLIDDFYNEKEVVGLTKSKEDDNIIYSIDVTKTITTNDNTISTNTNSETNTTEQTNTNTDLENNELTNDNTQ